MLGVRANLIQHEVLSDGELANKTVPLTILRHESESGLNNLGGGRARGVLAINADRSRRRLNESKQGGSEFRLTITLHSGDAENLTPRNGQ